MVAGQLHTPAVEIEETVFTDSMRIAVEEKNWDCCCVESTE